MSDLGYQNHAQASLTPLQQPAGYIRSLRTRSASRIRPMKPSARKRDGEWVQLNTNILQIENEYYSTSAPSA
jgi:glutamate--cysteine ligase